MAKLQYSIAAKNVLNKFYRVDKILYVEGPSDIRFWEIIFEAVNGPKVKPIESGGKQSLKKRIEEIQNDTADFLVAVDSDFDFFTNKINHPKVIRTKGYSIENTIASEKAIYQVIINTANISKQDFDINICRSWLDQLNELMQPLIISDINNRVKQLGIPVMGDACDGFMTTKKSADICSEKIKSHIESLAIESDRKLQRDIEKHLRTFGLVWCDLLRGHFFISLVMRFVRLKSTQLGANFSSSTDVFIGSLITAFAATFDAQHSHFEHYKEMISAV